MANIAIAIEAAKAKGLAGRVAVLDWDVHHGNGTEAIFYDRDDVLSISIHQEHNYPLDTGNIEDRGQGDGVGYNLNVPLPAGAGHSAYLHAMDRIVAPSIEAYNPDIIIVACGYDAAVIDPPRAGAEQQVHQLAKSQMHNIAMVSCNPVTFARDARILCETGFKIRWLEVVDQFRWSSHIEIVASFFKD